MKFSVKSLSAVLVAAVILSGVVLSADTAENTVFNLNAPKQDYESYSAEYYGEEYPLTEITVTADKARLSGAALTDVIYNGSSVKAVSLGDKIGTAVFPLTVEKAGLYRIALNYRALDGAEDLSPIEIDVTVDRGTSPDYAWLKELTLERIYKNAEEIRTDADGNEMTPEQQELCEWNRTELKSIYSKPLYIYFGSGAHTVEISAARGEVILYSLSLCNVPDADAYTEPVNPENNVEYTEKIEAENYLRKSSASIIPENDPADINTTPNDPVKQKLNYISGSKYKEAGSWVEYTFTVPEDGYYSFDFRVRQNYNSGMSSVRSITIDGTEPFAECGEIMFPYSGGWYIKHLGEDKPYRFYLKKGEHILRLTAAYGSLSEVVASAEEIIFALNELYSSVIMRIGTNPDKYRDYNLKDEIKGIDQKISALYDDIDSLGEMIAATNGGKTGSAMSSVETLKTMLSQFKQKPDALALKLDTLKNNIEALASFVNNLREQPLDLDYIRVFSDSIAPKQGKASFFKKLAFDVKRLLASFGSEYNDEETEDGELTVWANVGRDQMKILKRQIESGFRREYNAKVELAINTDITGAILAGVGPDVCLFLTADTPVNFAVRGVLEDLSRFEDFEDIAKRFDGNALVPYESVGGCYALPLSVSWPMMFVRNDIFESLQLEVPETWGDMYKAAAVLQRNHLEIGIPSHVGMFFTLLYQNGGSVYNEDLKTTFGDSHSLSAFSTWTSFFSEYSFPLSFDFFNRFRSGEMPIGIADYTMYAQIKAAAPEIRNQWSMFALPGTKGADGKINSAVSISTATGITATSGLAQGASAAVIFSDSKNKSLAWNFLCWLTSAEVQAEYGLGIEAELGYLGRYATANLEAIERLPWTADELAVLNSARKNIVMIDEYPGSYFIAREVNNAFRSVVNDSVNPADILSRKNVLINKELQRKYKQFGITKDGVAE